MRTIVLLTVCSFGAGIAPAATIYSDSTFNPSDWTVVTQSSTGDASMTFAQAAGGNPGPSRTMTYTTSGQTGSSSVRLASINPLFIYDPGVSGAIAGSRQFSGLQRLGGADRIRLPRRLRHHLFESNGMRRGFRHKRSRQLPGHHHAPG